MDKFQPITRRAALIGALVSSATLAVPVAAATIKGPAATIADLFGEWRAVQYDPAGDETAEQFDARWRRYVALQRTITSMRPRTVREAAMQLVVETDDGGSDFRNAFYRRVRKLAMEG